MQSISDRDAPAYTPICTSSCLLCFSVYQEPDLTYSDEEDDADVEEDSEGEASLQGVEGSKPGNSSQLPDTMQTSTEAREAGKTSPSSAAGKLHMPGTAKTAGLRAGFFTGEAAPYLRLKEPCRRPQCYCHHLFSVKLQHRGSQQQCIALQHVGRLHAYHRADLCALMPSVGAGAAKARASGKAKRSSAQKAESGNGIVDVSDDGSEEPSTAGGGAHSGACRLLCAHFTSLPSARAAAASMRTALPGWRAAPPFSRNGCMGLGQQARPCSQT